ncbi:MAG: OmpH family outer membrane protein [Acidobacteria bacterium]|nr:OmpH family outer membrane protein [Acidobacteriota bacterium]
MKKNLLRLIVVVSAISGFVFAAHAQVPVAVPTKVGWIDTNAFSDAKVGITKYVAGLKTIEDTMKPQLAELQGLQTRLAAIIADVNKLQAANPVNQAELAAKQLDGAKIEREFEFKKKEYEADVTRKRNEVIGPITADIMKVLQDFAKQKGYATMFDIGSLAQTNSLLFLDPLADTTKDFITFYNSRAAAPPK